MRCELMGVEDALHRTQAHACRLLQHRPVGALHPLAAVQSQINDLLHGGGQAAVARPAGLVAGEPVDALGHEPRLLPPPQLRFARSAHDLGGAVAVGRRG